MVFRRKWHHNNILLCLALYIRSYYFKIALSTCLSLSLSQVQWFLRMQLWCLMLCCWTCGIQMMVWTLVYSLSHCLVTAQCSMVILCDICIMAHWLMAQTSSPGMNTTLLRGIIRNWYNGILLYSSSQLWTKCHIWYICGWRSPDQWHGAGANGNVCGGETLHHHPTIFSLWRERKRYLHTNTHTHFVIGMGNVSPLKEGCFLKIVPKVNFWLNTDSPFGQRNLLMENKSFLNKYYKYQALSLEVFIFQGCFPTVEGMSPPPHPP